MSYDKNDRRAINKLSGEAGNLLSAIEAAEQGQLVAVPEMCQALENPKFFAFSCLSGDGRKEELGQDLGSLFASTRKIRVIDKLLEQMGNQKFKVIIDDTEPVRVWQWKTAQEEISEWCRLVIEEAGDEIAKNWEIKLWSDIELGSVNYDQVLAEVTQPRHALLVHQHLEHMRKFPNKKLTGDIQTAAIRRVAQYALQGIVLEKALLDGILFQSETPWLVKDPLYQPLRTKKLPIVHPFEERR